jgi:hypothetical protein
METICLSATEKPATERTRVNTGRGETTLNARTRIPTNKPVEVTMRTDVITDLTTKKKEKSQHIVIDVQITTAEPSSNGSVNSGYSSVLILSLLISLHAFLVNGLHIT